MSPTLRSVLRSGLLAALLFSAACTPPYPEVPRISPAEALEMAARGEAVFIDVRTARTFATSAIKIRGAVREDPEAVDAWAARYAAPKALIFYCA